MHFIQWNSAEKQNQKEICNSITYLVVFECECVCLNAKDHEPSEITIAHNENIIFMVNMNGNSLNLMMPN